MLSQSMVEFQVMEISDVRGIHWQGDFVRELILDELAKVLFFPHFSSLQRCKVSRALVAEIEDRSSKV